MTPLDTNKDVESVRESAIAFYDCEKGLTSEDRKQLYVFFEQQCRRMLLGFSTGVAIGAAAPFIIRKKGSLVHPGFPVFGAVLGGTIVPGFVNHKIYNMQVEDFKRKFGDHSPICETIKNTPDPINKAVFWSNYFKKSSSDPNFRMKDPRLVQGTKFFSIDDVQRVPPYGKPGYYKSDEIPMTLNEQYLSGWDKVRAQRNGFNGSQHPPIQPTQHKSDQIQYDSSAAVAYTEDDDPFQQDEEEKGKAFSVITKTDHLVSVSGAAGSSWDRIRRESR